MRLPSTRLGVGLVLISGLLVSVLCLGVAWDIESEPVFLLGTLLLVATAFGTVGFVLGMWPEAPESKAPGAWQYLEALAMLISFFGLWLTMAEGFGPDEYELGASFPVLQVERASLDFDDERIAQSTGAEGHRRLELRLWGRTFRHQGPVPFEVRLCGDEISEPPAPERVGEEALHLRLIGTGEAAWREVPASPAPPQDDGADDTSLPDPAPEACLVHRDELLARIGPPAPGMYRLAVRWAGLEAELELEVQPRVLEQAWLLAPDVIAWQDGYYTEVHTPFDPTTGALTGGPVVSARPPPDFEGPVMRWLMGSRGEPRWLIDDSRERVGLGRVELRPWDRPEVGGQARVQWVTYAGSAAPGGLVLGSPESADMDDAVILVGYVGHSFAVGRPAEGLVEWVKGPMLQPGTLRRGLPLLWTDAGSGVGETQLLAVGQTLEGEGQLLFRFSVPHAPGVLPTYLGEVRRYPSGSAWAGDRALWLTSAEGDQQVLTRVGPGDGPESRWELGAAQPGRLRGARLGPEGAQVLLEDSELGWFVLAESGGPCSIPDEPLLAVLLGDGRLLAAHSDGLRVHALACPSVAAPPAEPPD